MPSTSTPSQPPRIYINNLSPYHHHQSSFVNPLPPRGYNQQLRHASQHRKHHHAPILICDTVQKNHFTLEAWVPKAWTYSERPILTTNLSKLTNKTYNQVYSNTYLNIYIIIDHPAFLTITFLIHRVTTIFNTTSLWEGVLIKFLFIYFMSPFLLPAAWFQVRTVMLKLAHHHLLHIQLLFDRWIWFSLSVLYALSTAFMM